MCAGLEEQIEPSHSGAEDFHLPDKLRGNGELEHLRLQLQSREQEQARSVHTGRLHNYVCRTACRSLLLLFHADSCVLELVVQDPPQGKCKQPLYK